MCGMWYAWYVTQATLFCSQNSPVKLKSSKKHVNCCVFSMSGGHTKNLQKPKENQPPASESGLCAPSRGRAAGDHSRAPQASKAVVPRSRRRCGCSDRRQARTQCWRSETLEIRWKIKGKHHALLVCRKHHCAFQQSETARRTGAASPCQEHQRAHRNRTWDRTALTAG